MTGRAFRFQWKFENYGLFTIKITRSVLAVAVHVRVLLMMDDDGRSFRNNWMQNAEAEQSVNSEKSRKQKTIENTAYSKI
jgi:hypothetical protein